MLDATRSACSPAELTTLRARTMGADSSLVAISMPPGVVRNAVTFVS